MISKNPYSKNKRKLRKFVKGKTLKQKKQFLKLDKITLNNIYPLKFKKLIERLNKFFKKSIEFNLIRLHYPYKDSNILAKLITFMINKIKIRRITRKIFKEIIIKSIKKKFNVRNKTNIIPAFLSGINIKIAGRLMKYKIIPKKTVKIYKKGSSSKGKINYKNFSRNTTKNKRGTFSISIKAAHNFF